MYSGCSLRQSQSTLRAQASVSYRVKQEDMASHISLFFLLCLVAGYQCSESIEEGIDAGIGFGINGKISTDLSLQKVGVNGGLDGIAYAHKNNKYYGVRGNADGHLALERKGISPSFTHHLNGYGGVVTGRKMKQLAQNYNYKAIEVNRNSEERPQLASSSNSITEQADYSNNSPDNQGPSFGQEGQFEPGTQVSVPRNDMEAYRAPGYPGNQGGFGPGNYMEKYRAPGYPGNQHGFGTRNDMEAYRAPGYPGNQHGFGTRNDMEAYRAPGYPGNQHGFGNRNDMEAYRAPGYPGNQHGFGTGNDMEAYRAPGYPGNQGGFGPGNYMEKYRAPGYPGNQHGFGTGNDMEAYRAPGYPSNQGGFGPGTRSYPNYYPNGDQGYPGNQGGPYPGNQGPSFGQGSPVAPGYGPGFGSPGYPSSYPNGNQQGNQAGFGSYNQGGFNPVNQDLPYWSRSQVGPSFGTGSQGNPQNGVSGLRASYQSRVGPGNQNNGPEYQVSEPRDAPSTRQIDARAHA